MALIPFPVDDGIPEEVVVAWVVCYLNWNRAGSPSGVRVEQLRSWLHAATRKKWPDSTHWENVVGLIQAAFLEGHLAEECTW